MVTVAIGTSYQLLKISVPKEVRSIQQNKTKKKTKDLCTDTQNLTTI